MFLPNDERIIAAKERDVDGDPRDGTHPSSAHDSAGDSSDDLMSPYGSPDRAAGLSLSQVLVRYTLVLLGLGVVGLVWLATFGVDPYIALWLIYVVAVESTALFVGAVAIIVGIGALIALMWADEHPSAVTPVRRRVVRNSLVVGTVSAVTLVLSVVYPAISPAIHAGTSDSPLGQFQNVHRVVTGLQPSAIAADDLGSVYVLDGNIHKRIVKVSPSGTLMRAMSVGNSLNDNVIDGVAITSEGDAYASAFGVAYGFPSEIGRFPVSGRHSSSWLDLDGVSFRVDDSALAVDRGGSVYLGGTYDFGAYLLVREYSPRGRLRRMWKSMLGDGYASAVGMAVDGSGNIYVGDEGGSRLQSFTPAGRLRWTWTTTDDSGVGNTDAPGVAVDRAGNVYTSGSATFRVEKISPTGRSLSAWPVPRGMAQSEPAGVAVDRQGSVYVLMNGVEIFKYSSSGEPLAIWR
jgi:sugar lactone lactonase YvrE